MRRARPVLFTPETDERLVEIPADRVVLTGEIAVPENAKSLVVLVQGGGSGRSSPENLVVASALLNSRIATLLVDLLADNEKTYQELRSDVQILSDRLQAVTLWIGSEPDVSGLRIGYFAAGTGVPAALGAAADLSGHVSALVLAGGRPDLAVGDLDSLTAATLFIVGGLDEKLIEGNRHAHSSINVIEKELRIIPETSRLFEEPGALEEVSRLAAAWFKRYLEE
jgi:hypothetical protein